MSAPHRTAQKSLRKRVDIRHVSSARALHSIVTLATHLWHSSMAFRLPLDDVHRGIRLIARDQAARLKRAAAKPSPESALRQRKCLKKLRALVSLTQTAGQAGACRRLDRALRNHGRSLAAAREQVALAETLDRLIASKAPVSPALVRALRKALRLSQQRAITPATRADLAKLIQHISRFAWDRLTAARIIANASRTYRDARRALTSAVDADTSVAFHDWRKRVQRHLRHMQLLADLWPEDLALRVAAAKHLARLLGEDHDLHVFSVWLSDQRLTKTNQKARQRLMKAIGQRQAELRREAHTAGLRLFAERPKAFRRRLIAYARLTDR